MKGIEQGRASYAYKRVEDAMKLLPKENHKFYKSYVKKFPTLVKTNGLGAALAFVFSKQEKKEKNKKEDAYFLMYQQIEKWLPKSSIPFENGQGDLCKYVVGLDSFQYRAITLEILALFNWLRRFAEGMIGGDDE